MTMLRIMLCVILLLSSRINLSFASNVFMEWTGNYSENPQGTWKISKSNGCSGSYTTVQTQGVGNPVACQEGPNIGQVTCANWTDTNVISGQTYCWIVIGVDVNGKESTPSNVLQFQVPQESTVPLAVDLHGEVK